MTKFDWVNYNLKRNKEAIKINRYNETHNVNFLEKGVYRNVRDIYALAIIISKTQKKKINVLDYGGNLMSHVNLRNKIDIKNIKIYIFNPYSKKNNLTSNKPSIITLKKIEQLKKKKFDIIYFGSILQYIEKISAIQKSIINNTRYVLITHTPITFNSESFKAIQRNEKKLIQNIHNFKSLKKQMLNNFDLIFKSINDFSYSGLRKKSKNTYSLNMLFKKRN